MGGSSKVTIGYQYYLGVHFVLGLGPIDRVNSIEVDRRQAWVGPAEEEQITINAPELFGGRKREGGISGLMDLAFGKAAQVANDYLEAAIGVAQTAYRGATSAILRQGYIGNNPYLKPWAFRLQRIEAVDPGYNSGAQWYLGKAKIPQRYPSSAAPNVRVYIAVDVSDRMYDINELGDGKLMIDHQYDVVVAYLERERSLRAASRSGSYLIIAPGTNLVNDWIQRDNCADADYDALIAFMGNLVQGQDPIMQQTVTKVADFFDNSADPLWGNLLFVQPNNVGEDRLALLLTCINDTYNEFYPTYKAVFDAVPGLKRYGFFFDNDASALGDASYFDTIDNTPDDAEDPSYYQFPPDAGVAIIYGNDPTPLLAAGGAGFTEWDMNPAHIIREVLLSPDTGGSGNNADAGSTFTACADTLYAEGFGLSLTWSAPSRRSEFLELIEQHIDATVYVDRRTGLWEMKLIRDDYGTDLQVFDTSNVIAWDDFAWPETHSLVNQVVVTWTDPEKDEPGSMTLTNPAMVLQAGRVIQEKRDYPGINRADLAARVARRDLLALSASLLRGSITATHVPLEINRGSVIVLNNPRLGIDNVICRVQEIDEGDGRDNSVTLKVVEDRFTLEAAGLSDVPVITPPLPQILSPTPRMVEEATYFDLVRELGAEAVDELLLSDPDLGFLHAAAGSPNAIALSANLYVDAGAGYAEEDTISFAPATSLWSDLSRRADHVKVIAAYDPSLNSVEAGTLALVNGELMRVDTMALGGTWAPGDYWAPPVTPTGDLVTITFGRGCLDTPPEEHFAGDAILFFYDISTLAETRYQAAETINAKMRTVTTRGEQTLSAAIADPLTFAARAYRPFPPGQVQVDGAYGGVGAWESGSRTFTWAHRDRLTQTTTTFDDHTAGNIGPEPGVTYSVRVIAVDAAGAVLETLYSATGLTGTSLTIDAATDWTAALPANYDAVWFEIWSERADGSGSI